MYEQNEYQISALVEFEWLLNGKVANHYSHWATVELSFVLVHNQTDDRSVGPVFAVNVLTL